MTKTKIASAVALVAFALSIGVSFAQTANNVTVSSTPVTTSPGPGSTGVTLGTFMLTGTNGATYSVTSVPITLATANGAQPTELSDCQLFNSNNAALNSGNNQMNALVNGNNTITLDQPLSVNGTATTLTLRCNVGSGAVSGGTYQFIAGTPVFTTTSTGTTGTSPMLGVSLTTVPSVNAGVQNAVLALLTLDASNSNQNVSVTSIPVMLSFSGADPSNYSNCSLRSASSLTTPLNTGNNAITATTNGTISFTLDTPLSIAEGSADILALTCSISPSTAAGSSIAVSLNPGSVMANSASSGTFTPVVSTNTNGTAVPTSGTVEITMPSTSTTVTTPVTTTEPGAPNTGAGGNSTSNLIAIVASLLVALGGVAFILKRQTR
jgi:hypothetical protein